MSREADWLLRELPSLVEQRVLDEPTALRLRTHYAAAAGSQGLGWGMILLAIGGAALVGLGIILIFAHNWENWTPGVRVVLSMLPLLAGQLAAAHALRGNSRAWREGAGLFTALSIGAAIALIAQTYQFGGDLPRFILTWLLLALPLVYLLDASAVAGLCWLGALGWTLTSGDGWFSRHDTLQGVLRLPAFLLLATLPLPHLLHHIRLDRSSARVAWLLRIALAVLVIGYGASLPDHGLAPVLFTYAGMAAVAALSGRLWFADVPGLWSNPQYGLGLVGACGIALLATVRELWHDLDLPWTSLLLPAVALGLLALWMASRCWQRERSELAVALAALTPLLFLLAALGQENSGVSALLGHLYVAALATTLIRAGLRQSRLGLANLGILLIAALVLLRFFDSGLSYVLRGVGFIITGAGFFAANLWLRHRLQRPAP